MKALSLLMAIVFAWPCQGQLNPQSRKVTETFFPEMDIEINTPAFQKKKGFTRYEEMMGYLRKLQETHPEQMSIDFIGTSQKGKKIPIVHLRGPEPSGEKVKVWIQGGLHGNEPASTEGVLWLISRVLEEAEYARLLARMELAIVPMANIDGYEKQNRYAANGLDLNRDQTKLNAPESVALKQAFSDYDAEVALDFHEYRPYRRDFAQLSTWGITSRFDAMFLYSGNLNVPQNLRTFTRDVFVVQAEKKLDEHQLSHHDYVSTRRFMGDIIFNQGSMNARSSATSFALTNAVSCLFEVRGVGIGRTSFKRRVFTTFLLATSFLETAYDHVSEIKAEIRKANEASGAAVVTSEKKVSRESLPVIDLDKNREKDLAVIVHDAWESSPELTRPRPFAYLILPSEKALLEKLATLGVEVQELDREVSLEVETYQVTAYSQAPYKYEGVYQQDVSTEVRPLNRTFPKGTHILYMDQPHANLAIEVLEPEAPNSFVSFHVIHTSLGEELPVYRYLKGLKL